MEHKLSKHQLRMLISLSQQKEGAKKVYDEIAEAEKELFAMIIKYADLPEGDYHIEQEGDIIRLVQDESPEIRTPKKAIRREEVAPKGENEG